MIRAATDAARRAAALTARLDDQHARAHDEVVAGQYVMISVTDTGTQSRGHVKMHSEVGHGTSVKIYFPRFIGWAPGFKNRSCSIISAPIATGKEAILVVQDEEKVHAIQARADAPKITTTSGGVRQAMSRTNPTSATANLWNISPRSSTTGYTALRGRVDLNVLSLENNRLMIVGAASTCASKSSRSVM
jgi:hypothetical protein